MLSPAQRVWLATRLANHAPFTAQEITRLAPGLCAWATAREARLGAMVAMACGGEEAHVDAPGSLLSVLRQYPGDAGRAQAVQLHDGDGATVELLPT